MKRLCVIVIVMILYSVPAWSQGGLIGLYIDPWGNECDITDLDVGVIDVRVVHKLAPSAGACQFAIEASSGFTGVYLGEEVPLLDGGGIGNSQVGVAVAYGECLSSPIHLLTIRYLLLGTSAPNSYLEVVAHPTANPPGIFMADCSGPVPILLPAVGGRAYINNDGSVACTTTPTEPTTWGKIKSLYKN